MITATIAALSLLGGQAEKWDIKPTLTKDSKTTYAMEIDVTAGPESHTAKFKFTTTTGEKAADETYSTKVLWNAIEVDGNPSEDLPEWGFKIDKQGGILGVSGDLDDSYRRMITPYFFVYPDKGIAAGEKWEAKLGAKKDAFTFKYEAKGIEKVKDEDAMKITGTFKEGEGDMSGDGTWWVGKNGKIVKFDMKIKNWTIPFTGGPDKLDANVKGAVG